MNQDFYNQQNLNNNIYNQPVQPNNTTPPTPKKMNLGLIIGIVALVVVVGIGVVFGSKLFSGDKKQSTGTDGSNDIPNNISISDSAVLMKTDAYYTGEFWGYKERIKTITFETKINIPKNAVKSWDVSENKNGAVMAYIKTNASDPNYYDLVIQGNGGMYANTDSSYLFSDFYNVESIKNMEFLDTSIVTNMSYMFYNTGEDSAKFTLDLGERFDTSNVTNMSYMFCGTGESSTIFTLDLGDKFDTGAVTDMSAMFYDTGKESGVFSLDLGEKFDTGAVTDMSGMFWNTGYSSEVFTLDLGDKFDTSNVMDMSTMFVWTGNSSKVFSLDLGDKFDTSNVTDMSRMFWFTGAASTSFTLSLGDKFDTSNVTDMLEMFWMTGNSSGVFQIDCSDWNVSKVKKYYNFNFGVETKVTPPNWVN